MRRGRHEMKWDLVWRRARREVGTRLHALRLSAAARREFALRTKILDEMAELRRALGANNAGPGVLLHAYYENLIVRIREVYALRDRAYSDVVGQSQDKALALLRALAPSRCTSAAKARYGRIGDGGYVHLDHFDGLDAAISLGIGSEVSWDVAMAEHGLEVYQFDNSVDAPPTASPRFHFTRATVGEGNGELGLAEIVAIAGVVPARTILKIDVEGAEWDLLAAAPDDLLGAFPQIVCEFHGLGSSAFFLDVEVRLATLARLNAHYRVIHIHGNNTSGVRLIGSLAIPEVLEVTYASRSRYVFTDSDEVFPTELDAPNDPGLREIVLGRCEY